MSTMLGAAGERSPLLFAPPRCVASRRLFLDLETLYDQTSWKRWLLQLVSRMGLQLQYDAFYGDWEDSLQRDVWFGKRDFWDALRHLLRLHGLRPGAVMEIEVACRDKFRQLDAPLRTFPGVQKTLATLRRSGWTLVGVSQVPRTSSQLDRHLERLHLVDAFTRFLPTTHRDYAKEADDLVFHHLADEQDVAFLGSHPRMLEGAGRAGAYTIGFNCGTPARAHVYLEAFAELLDVIDGPRPWRAAG